MRVEIKAADEIMARFGNQLASLGAGEAPRLMSMALNSEGNKGRTRVRRALQRQAYLPGNVLDQALQRPGIQARGRRSPPLEAGLWSEPGVRDREGSDQG